MFQIPPFNISASFDQIANDLFSNYIIHVNDNFYRLLEIEFYYNDLKEHNDAYTLGISGKNDQGIGMSMVQVLTLNRNEEAPGRILLRSIEKLLPIPTDKKEQYIFGPLNVLTELISGFNSCFDTKPNVFALVSPVEHIKDFEQVPQEEIIPCGRIGLSGKDEKYKSSLYRYLIYPPLPHKEKTNIALALKEKWGTGKESLDRIKKLLGSELLKEYR